MSSTWTCPRGHVLAAPDDSAPPHCPICETLALPTGGVEAAEQATLAPRPRAEEVDSAAPASPGWPTVAGYEILGILGRGGMGVVYRARQAKLNRPVALKMILAGGHAGDEERARFRREAEAVARLRHPGIVQIYDVGESEGRPFLSLEFVDGGSLEQKVNGTPLQPREAARLVKAMALAMEAAHSQGVIHRDLKPANILLQRKSEARNPKSEKSGEEIPDLGFGISDFEPKITDFGLAKQLGGAGQTQSGAILGTPSYMAPEQADPKGRAVGPAADVYALGAVLYELLTGRPPFRAATPLDTVLQVLSAEPVAPKQLQPKLPRDLETISLKCLRKDPAKRYAAARELADELDRFLAGDPIRARPVGWAERAARWVRKNPGKAATAAAAVLIAGLGIAFLVVESRRERDRAEALQRANDAAQDALADARRRKAEAERAGDSARRARDQADRARRKAVTAERGAQAARDAAVDQLYATRIGLAYREWQENNVYRTEQLLNECPAALRGWEWDFLRGLCRQERRTLYGHMSPVHLVAVSPDGRHLASGDGSATHYWNLETGREIFTQPADGPLAFSPNRTHLAMSHGKTVKVLDAREGREVCELPEGKGKVIAVAFADGGRQVRTATYEDHAVHHWDAATGRHLRTRSLRDGFFPLNNYAAPFWPAFGTGGTLLAAGGDFGDVRVWDTATGKLLFSVHDGPLMHVTRTAFSPEGDRLAVAWAEGTVMLREVPSGKALWRWRAHRGSTEALAFSPDGDRLATGSQDLSIRLWDLTAFEQVGVLRGHTGSVQSLEFTPDGKGLVSGGSDRAVKVWDLHDRRYFSRDRKQQQFFRRVLSGAPVQLPAGTFEHRTFYGHMGPARVLAFSPDGSLVATSNNGDGRVTVWDLASNKDKYSFRTYGGQRRAAALAFSPDGKRFLGVAPPSGNAPGEVRLWEIGRSRQVGERTGLPGTPVGLAFAADGKSAVAAFVKGQSSLLCWWRIPSLEETGALDLDAIQVHNLAQFPGDDKLVAGGAEQIVVIDAAAHRVEQSFRVPGMTCLALSRGGTVATGHSDTRIRLFNLASGKPLGELEGHVAPLNSLAFSPDGRRLVSVAGDRAIKIWNVATGRELLTFRDHVREVERVAWSPDGRKIASVGWDHALRVWEAAPAGGPSAERWPVLFADNFNRRSLGPNWPPAANWSVERGALRGVLGDFMYQGGWDKFANAVIYLRGVRLPDTVEIRFDCWAPRPLVCNPVLMNTRTGLTIHPMLIGADRLPGSDTAHSVLGGADRGLGSSGAALLLMRGAGAQGEVVGVPRRKFRFVPGRRYHVQVLRERTWLTLTVDGEVLFREAIPADPAPMLALDGSWGHVGDVVHFAHLEVRAPPAAVREQKLRDWVETLFDRYLLRAAVEKEIREDRSLGEADRQFALGQLSALREDPEKLLAACRAVVLHAGRAAKAYAFALRQAEAAVRLAPSSRPARFLLGCARYRVGRYAVAEKTLTRALEAHRQHEGSGAPDILAVLAMAQHRAARAEAARAALGRARDLLRAEAWADGADVRPLIEEASALIRTPSADRKAEAVKDVVLGADQAGWYHGNLSANLDAFTPDCQVVQARAERPAGWDVTLDRRPLEDVRRYQVPATAALRLRISYDDVGVRVIGSEAECRFQSTIGSPPFFHTWAVVARLRQTPGGWKIFRLRSWPVRENQPTAQTFDGAYWEARDRAVDRARRGASRRKLAQALEDARRYAEALPVARELTRRPRPTASDWVLCGRVAFALGRTGEAREAFREALRRDPGVELPWYFSRLRRTLGGGAGAVFGVDWQPGGKGLASGGTDGLLKLWGMKSSQPRTLRGPLGWILGLAIQPGGKIIATAGTDYWVKLWDVSAGRELRTLRGHEGRVYSVAFNPSGRKLVTGSADRTARIWDVASGRPLVVLRHPGEVTAVAFSPDGQQIATASRDGTARLWEAASGRPVRRLRGHSGEVLDVTYSPDGRRLATGGDDGSVHLWDAATGDALATLRGHTAAVGALVFSPDGSRLVSGGNGTEIILWDARAGKALETLRGRGGSVLGLALNQDGSLLASASADGTVRVWDMGPR
jgi:WD40 repeat protein/tetratricopeptide (TPR) repeat protein/tRNA A-37 threonylcarbamoyl transferase component Bud32